MILYSNKTFFRLNFHYLLSKVAIGNKSLLRDYMLAMARLRFIFKPVHVVLFHHPITSLDARMPVDDVGCVASIIQHKRIGVLFVHITPVEVNKENAAPRNFIAPTRAHLC